MAILTLDEAFWQSRCEEAENLINELLIEIHDKFESFMDEETDNLVARSNEFLDRMED